MRQLINTSLGWPQRFQTGPSTGRTFSRARTLPPTHCATEPIPWVLRHRGVAISGAPADSLVSEIPTQALRDEAARLAVERKDSALAEVHAHDRVLECRAHLVIQRDQNSAEQVSLRSVQLPLKVGGQLVVVTNGHAVKKTSPVRPRATRFSSADGALGARPQST